MITVQISSIKSNCSCSVESSNLCWCSVDHPWRNTHSQKTQTECVWGGSWSHFMLSSSSSFPPAATKPSVHLLLCPAPSAAGIFLSSDMWMGGSTHPFRGWVRYQTETKSLLSFLFCLLHQGSPFSFRSNRKALCFPFPRFVFAARTHPDRWTDPVQTKLKNRNSPQRINTF